MKIVELLKEFEEKKAALLEELTSKFKEEAEELFEKCDNLTHIQWVQYTPYFNDGDPCYFEIGDFYFGFGLDKELPESLETLCYEDGKINGSVLDKYDVKYEYPILNDFANIFSSDTGKELFLNMFGDHARVTISKDGIDVEEYDHD